MVPNLDDPWDNGQAPSQVNGFERPHRVEDDIPVHRNPRDGRPLIWLPDGSKAIHYSRPSSWGKKVEDTTNLSKWETRVTVSGYLDFGDQSRALRAERAALGPSEATAESKKAHSDLNERAKGLVSSADRVGTAVHTITERDDLGLPVHGGDDFQADLEEWRRLTKEFQIIEMPDGRPGVECFVALDHPRYTPDGDPVLNRYGHHDHVRLAGTFDRLVRYKPCEVCGRRVYVLDLKTGKNSSISYNGLSWAVQFAIYGNAVQYLPHADGQGATRLEIPDVCPHKGIAVALPAGTGRGQVYWVNIGQGFHIGTHLVPLVKDARGMKNWIQPFAPTPDLRRMIDACRTAEEVRQLWYRYPSDEWVADNNALIAYATARRTAIEGGAI
jgi:hypothetical protein